MKVFIVRTLGVISGLAFFANLWGAFYLCAKYLNDGDWWGAPFILTAVFVGMGLSVGTVFGLSYTKQKEKLVCR